LAVSFAGGNELYLTCYFVAWLLFTSFGAMFINIKSAVSLFVIFFIAATGSAAFIIIAPVIFGLHSGIIVDPVRYAITILLSLCLLCLVNGAIFRAISSQGKDENKAGYTYGSEAIGALAGGVLTAVYYYSGGRDFSLILSAGLLCLLPVFEKKAAKFLLVVFSGILLLLQTGDIAEAELLKIRYRPFNHVGSISGKTVRYDIIEQGGLYTLYSGGVKVAEYPDQVAPRELYYWAIMAKPALSEIMFVNSEFHDYGDIVPDSIDYKFISNKYRWQSLLPQSYATSKTRFIKSDPLAYFEYSDEKYDAIVVSRAGLMLINMAPKLVNNNQATK